MTGKYVLTYLFILIMIMISPLALAATDNSFQGTVVKVVDGDTIQVKVRSGGGEIYRVRMVGIDTPETYMPADVENEAYAIDQKWHGERASKYLKRILPEGARVKIMVGDKLLGSYERILGRIVYNGRDINRAVLERGYAALYVIYPYDHEIIDDYIKVAQRAYEKGRGMFKPEKTIKYLPYEFRYKAKGMDIYRLVGDYETGLFYDPSQYKKIPVYHRIFFENSDDAKADGYEEAN